MFSSEEKRREYQRAYYLAHCEEIKARQREYASQNRDRISAYSKQHREANLEQCKARSKAYYEAHREERIEYQKALHASKPEAIKAYKKEWWERHRPEHLRKKRLHWAKNQDVIREKQRQKYQADPEPFKARAKAFAAANPDKVREMARSYRACNPSRLNAVKGAWQRADYRRNPEKYKEIQGRRKALKRQSRTERVDFKKILKESNGVCGICRKPFDLFGIDFDHIIPLSRGGAHATDNIQATHSRCNRVKGAKLETEVAV